VLWHAGRRGDFGLFFRAMRGSCVVFVAAVCILFLVKLKWPKNKSVYNCSVIEFSLKNSDTLFVSVLLKN